MTDTPAPGLFPPEGVEDGTYHYVIACDGDIVERKWGEWYFAGNDYPTEASSINYLGPVPTHEQAEADRADAERFRWCVKQSEDGEHLDDIFWNQRDATGIRAAIDEAMGKKP